PSSRVIFRIGAEHESHIQWKSDGITLTLNVTLLHDVKQPYLDFPCEVRQFVNGKDPAIGARQQSVMHGQFAAEFVSTSRRLDGIDVSYQIGNGYVRRGQLLHVAVVRRQISDRSIVPLLSALLPPPPANRRVRIIVNLT